MKLYYAPGACSLSPHIALREGGFEFEIEKVDLKAKLTESGQDYSAINPKGYVPALRLDDGEVITEGPAIVQYLADLKPQAGLAPKPATLDRARLQEHLTFIGTEIHKSFSPLFSPATTEEGRAAAIDKIGKRFGIYENHLAAGRDYLMGESFSVADGYLFAVVRWTERFKIDLAPWPNLAAFFKRMSERPAVQAALKAEGLA